MTLHSFSQTLTTEVPQYWFGAVDDSTALSMQHEAVQRWNAKSPAVDEFIRTQFLSIYRDLRGEAERGWAPASLAERVGAVLVLDQFPRHIYRDQVGMYGSDSLAIRLTVDGLNTPEHKTLPMVRRMFLYMPLMHSERVDDQRRCVQLFDEMREDVKTRSPQNVQFFEMSYHYARRHLEIVERFGRFPHRNEILGRPTTEAEAAFLKEPNSSF
ncbi:DUF924 family protein [Ideonella sp. DXS29W]|uniref:DUF924 family protein n=1 Tax=Ideonella lacteola TaxID=2984193 RepID=A0ABU9BR93_9BURK